MDKDIIFARQNDPQLRAIAKELRKIGRINPRFRAEDTKQRLRELKMRQAKCMWDFYASYEAQERAKAAPNSYALMRFHELAVSWRREYGKRRADINGAPSTPTSNQPEKGQGDETGD